MNVIKGNSTRTYDGLNDMTQNTTVKFSGIFSAKPNFAPSDGGSLMDDLARRIREIASEADRSALIRRINSTESPLDTVAELGRNRDPEIRHWIADAAPDLLGPEAVPVLRELTSDSDLDVRIDALSALIAIDPAEARRMGPTIRKRATSEDFYEAQGAIWALGAIRDTEALEIIRRASEQPDAIPRNAAVAVELLLTAPEELCRRIAEHDHDLMPWLVKAAELLGTDEARRALEHCASEAPDEECRGFARRVLERF